MCEASQRAGVGERKILHHDDAGDAADGIDPEEGVVDAAPAQAAGASLARKLIGSDQEAEAPLVASVGDEGEILADRHGAVERRHFHISDGVLTHQRHGLGL